MPIGGFVLNFEKQLERHVISACSQFSELEIHGVVEDGQAAVVLDTSSSDEMEQLVRQIETIPGVLSLGAVYMHAEDEIDQIASGEVEINFSFGRKSEKPAQFS